MKNYQVKQHFTASKSSGQTTFHRIEIIRSNNFSPHKYSQIKQHLAA